MANLGYARSKKINPNVVRMARNKYGGVLTEQELKKLMTEKGFKELDEEKEQWGEKRISFDDADIDFYFENGKLISVNYSLPVFAPSFVILPN